MRPWVSKKIADYLGEEEPMLIKYVLEMLGEHAKAPLPSPPLPASARRSPLLPPVAPWPGWGC
jgi:hypothetical protein